MERLLVDELKGVFFKEISDKQFGYMTGRCTEDLIVEVVRIVRARYEKYCYGLFLDMSGVFDRVWWPEIMQVI